MLNPDTYTPTRLVVQHGAPTRELDVFGEPVDPEEQPVGPPPVRHIHVTEAMRVNDAREQRQRAMAAGSDWTIKRELRVENLKFARRIVVPAGRVQPHQEAARIEKRQARKYAGKGGRSPLPKACRWCQETLSGYRQHRQHEATCPQRPRKTYRRASSPRKCRWCGETFLGLKPLRAHVPNCFKKATHVGKNPKVRCGCGRGLRADSVERGLCYTCHSRKKRAQRTAAQRHMCAAGCGRQIRRGSLERTDQRCARCGAVADLRARRHEAMKPCAVCGKPLRKGTRATQCRSHLNDPEPASVTIHRPTTEGEQALDQAWASLCLEDKELLFTAFLANTSSTHASGKERAR